MSFKLLELGYSFDALEPYIDAKTMEIHHDKHHAGYTNNFNKAVEGTSFEGKPAVDILSSAGLPLAVRNNGGGFYNHALFWEFLSPKGGGKPSGKLADAIVDSFSSFDAFKDLFSKAAATRFGSGWAWLLVNSEGRLEVSSTPNQDNPLMNDVDQKGTPILNIDVWEHAYYLNYQNRRADYIQAFWNIVNWDAVVARFESI